MPYKMATSGSRLSFAPDHFVGRTTSTRFIEKIRFIGCYGILELFCGSCIACVRAQILQFKMPRRYKTVNTRNHWTTGQLDKAKEAVENGELNTSKAAEMYGIPYSTLRDRLKGKSIKQFGGRPSVLSFEEEKEISTSCQVLQKFGFPLNVDTAGIIVRDYLNDCKRENPFKNSLPGYDWWEGFLRRWPKLVQCKPQHLSSTEPLVHAMR